MVVGAEEGDGALAERELGVEDRVLGVGGHALGGLVGEVGVDQAAGAQLVEEGGDRLAVDDGAGDPALEGLGLDQEEVVAAGDAGVRVGRGRRSAGVPGEDRGVSGGRELAAKQALADGAQGVEGVGADHPEAADVVLLGEDAGAERAGHGGGHGDRERQGGEQGEGEGCRARRAGRRDPRPGEREQQAGEHRGGQPAVGRHGQGGDAAADVADLVAGDEGLDGDDAAEQLHVQEVGEQQGGGEEGEEERERRPDSAGGGEHQQGRQAGGRDGDRQATAPGGEAGEVGEAEAEDQGGGPAPQGREAAQGGRAEAAAAGLDDEEEGGGEQEEVGEVAAAGDEDRRRDRQAGGGRGGPADVFADQADLEDVRSGVGGSGDPERDAEAGAGREVGRELAAQALLAEQGAVGGAPAVGEAVGGVWREGGGARVADPEVDLLLAADRDGPRPVGGA